MARVHFSSNQRRLTGGVAEVSLEAATAGELMRRLEEMFPGLGGHLASTSATAVAIDGDIVPNATYESLEPDAEVHLVIPIAGG